MDDWKAKAEAIEEDRRHLEDHIKASKRQNKVLRAAVERAEHASNVRSQKALHDSKTNNTINDDGTLAAPEGLQDTKASAKTLNPKKTTPEEQGYIDTMKMLKTELHREQQEIRLIRADRADAYSTKASLEEFFLECIDDSRKELNRRKRPGAQKPRDEAERMKELLLSSESVLVYLYEQLFPHRSGMAHQDALRSEVLCL